MSASMRIRAAEPADVELIYALIVELATYERSAERVTGTPELLADALSGRRPAAEALIAELDGEPVAFALFTPALDFYERLGARRLDEWVLHRLDGEALREVAAGSISASDVRPHDV